MGTFPLPVLCEDAALLVSITSALLEETARGGWVMQSLQMFGHLAPESLPKVEASAIPVTQEPELFIKDTT